MSPPTHELTTVLGSLALNGAAGGGRGFWVTFVALILAVVVVGGSLMVFLIRSARKKSTGTGHIGPGTNGFQGPDGRGPSER